MAAVVTRGRPSPTPLQDTAPGSSSAEQVAELFATADRMTQELLALAALPRAGGGSAGSDTAAGEAAGAGAGAGAGASAGAGPSAGGTGRAGDGGGDEEDGDDAVFDGGGGDSAAAAAAAVATVSSGGAPVDRWQYVKEDRGVKVFARETPELEQHVTMGVGDIAVPLERMRDLIEVRFTGGPLWDPLFESGEVVETLDKHTRVLHLRYSATVCLLKKKRDFVALHHWFEERSPETHRTTRFVTSARSVVHSAVGEPDAGYQRGEIFSSGYILTPTPDDLSRTRVTYVANMDLKRELTWMPDAMRQRLVAIVRERQPLNVRSLGDFCERRLAELKAEGVTFDDEQDGDSPSEGA